MAKKKQPVKSRRRSHVYSMGPVGGEQTVYRVYEARQCASKGRCLHEVRCQGVHGHKGPHWSYLPNGDLELWQSKKDIKGPWDWASSTIPPGHQDYPVPTRQYSKYWRHFSKQVKIGTEPPEPIPPKTAKLLREYAQARKAAKRTKKQ